MYMHLVYLVTSIGCSLHIVHDLISPSGMAIQSEFAHSNSFISRISLGVMEFVLSLVYV